MLEKLSKIRYQLIEIASKNLYYNQNIINTFSKNVSALSNIEPNNPNIKKYMLFFNKLIKHKQTYCLFIINKIIALPHNEIYEEKIKILLNETKQFNDNSLDDNEYIKINDVKNNYNSDSVYYNFSLLLRLFKKHYDKTDKTIPIRAVFLEFYPTNKNFNKKLTEADCFLLFIKKIVKEFSWELIRKDKYLYIKNFNRRKVDKILLLLDPFYDNKAIENDKTPYKFIASFCLVDQNIRLWTSPKIVISTYDETPSFYILKKHLLYDFLTKKLFVSDDFTLQPTETKNSNHNDYNSNNNFTKTYYRKKKEKVKSDSYVNVNNKEKYVSQYEDDDFWIEVDDADVNITERYENRVDYSNGYVRSKEDGWYYSDDDDNYNY